MSLFETYQPSELHFINNASPFCMDDIATYQNTVSPPIFPQTEDSPDISSSMQYLQTIFHDEYQDFPPLHVDALHVNSSMDDFQMAFKELETLFNGDFDHMPKALDETEVSCESNYHSNNPPNDGSHERNSHHDDVTMAFETSPMDMTASMHPSLVLPSEGMVVENQLSLIHLLMAYAEAMDNQEIELSEEIAQRIIQKVSLIGGITERVLYYMFRHLMKEQSDYLMQESTKNIYQALDVLYRIFPHGEFAHFVANSAIIEALPTDAKVIHLIDFDIGEGVQWASFMEAIKHLRKEIRLTSVKLSEEDELSPLRWIFEETEKRLCGHAASCGLKMEIEEVGLQDLQSVMRNTKRGDHGRKSMYVFNCNVGLPHMGRIRSTRDVFEFLGVAKSFLHYVKCLDNSRGVITCGDGDASHNTSTSSTMSYSSYLDGNFAHYQALLESMEFNFPSHLGEARIALEFLFVAPYVSSIMWEQKWEEKRKVGDRDIGLGLEGWELSEASLAEAKELVKEGVSLYGVRTEGGQKNEMVMQWNGIPMVRVCWWRS